MTPDVLTGFAAIFGTIVFTVFGQLVLKWQVAKAGSLPTGIGPKVTFLIEIMSNPWILGSIAAGFLAFLCWTTALTKFELSYAYPFMSASFLLVLVLSVGLLHETLTWPKAVGVILVMMGIIIGSRG